MIKQYDVDTIIVVGDQHFGIKRNNLTWLQTQLDYFNDFLIPLVKKELKKGKKIVVVLLGDLFHHRQILHLKILSEVQIILNTLSELCPIHMILGNHDVYYVNSNDVNSPTLLDLNNVTIFEKPTDVMYGDTHISHIPWITNKKELKAVLNNTKGDIIFTHCDINDIPLNSFKVVDYGLDQTVFDKFKYVFNGHIHIHEKIKNIYNVGSILHMDRNDVGNRKGVYIFDLNSGTPTFVENRISPEYLYVHLQDIPTEDLLDDNYIINMVKNNYVDVYVPNNLHISHSRLQEIMELIANNSNSSKRIDMDIELEEDWESIDIHETFSTNKNILLDFFAIFIEKQEIKSVNKNRLKNDVNRIVKGLDIGQDIKK